MVVLPHWGAAEGGGRPNTEPKKGGSAMRHKMRDADVKWVFGDEHDPANLIVYGGREITKEQLAAELYMRTGRLYKVSYETHLTGPGDYAIDVVVEEVDDDDWRNR